MKGAFWAYFIMRVMVHYIEKYTSEKLFDENDLAFFKYYKKMNYKVG